MKNCLRPPPDYGVNTKGEPAQGEYAVLEYGDTACSVLWNISLVHQETDGYGGEIIVGHTREFGYVLFYEGEIQITQSDFRRFHDFVAGLAGCENATEILIVGDGDGGFTRYPWSVRTTYVEPSRAMRIVGERFFGARWDKPRAIYNETLEAHLLVPTRKYDVTVLAITENFGDKEGLCDVLKQVAKISHKMVCTVGTVNDPGYYRNLPKFIAFGEEHSRQFGFHPLFCPGFMSEIVFFVAEL